MKTLKELNAYLKTNRRVDFKDFKSQENKKEVYDFLLANGFNPYRDYSQEDLEYLTVIRVYDDRDLLLLTKHSLEGNKEISGAKFCTEAPKRSRLVQLLKKVFYV